MIPLLEIKDLSVSVANKEILNSINLVVHEGEVHVLMGPNGSGKSTLANVIMGNPKYEITQGVILFKGNDITQMSPEEKAKIGVFLSFQYPREIAGLTLERFLYTAYNELFEARKISEKKLSVFGFHKKLQEELQKLGLDESFAKRHLNVGFSGGEKKKIEMLQLSLLQPHLAILDETDSGLDVDALKIIGNAVNQFKSKEKSLLLVTHYQRILDYVKPDTVSIMKKGKIVKQGSSELVSQIEEQGFEKI